MKTVRFSEKVMQNARKIQEECMGAEDAFCKSRCPMSTDVKKYVKCIAEGKYEDAVKVIRECLFLPNTLGRICAHPCESECRRQKEFGQAISIAALKRFAAEQADDEALWDVSVGEVTGKKVAVIGSGPAGAQAAVSLRKMGHQVTVYERMERAGGMLRYGIPKYRLPKEVLDYEYTYLDKLGVEFRFGCNVGTDVKLDELQEAYDAVLIANGAQKGNLVRVPGNDAEGVCTATEFLKEINLTERYAKAGKKILVIGGGDVAMDCARSAVRIGAEQVIQCSLESLEQLPASEEERIHAEEEGVLCNYGWGPDEIISEAGKIRAVRVRKVLSVFDEEGRFSPKFGDETKKIEADTVVMATGQLVEDITDGAIAQGGGGRYLTDADTLATSLENVFAAGDAAGGKVVVEAMALGRKAAVSIDRYINGKSLTEDRDLKHEWAYDTKLDVPLPEGTENLPRIGKNMRPAEERKQDFLPTDYGFTEEQAREEAGRCLECECRLCMKECMMMQDFGSCPKDAFAALAQEGKMEAMLAYSCNDCDSCTVACPKDLPVRETLMEARKDFAAANGGESPLAGHRPVKIHQTLAFSSMFTTKVRGGKADE